MADDRIENLFNFPACSNSDTFISRTRTGRIKIYSCKDIYSRLSLYGSSIVVSCKDGVYVSPCGEPSRTTCVYLNCLNAGKFNVRKGNIWFDNGRDMFELEPNGSILFGHDRSVKSISNENLGSKFLSTYVP